LRKKKRFTSFCPCKVKGNQRCGKPVVFGKNYCEDHAPKLNPVTYSVGKTKFSGNKSVEADHYSVYIQSVEWQVKSSLERTKNPNCSLCNRKGVLHVHHRTYVRLGEEKDGDLIVLCSDCHELFHNFYRYSGKVGYFVPK